MTGAMSKRERVEAAIAGQPVDRTPVSFWGHDYAREWSAETHAAQTLEFVRRHDLDYVKINPRFSYLMEAFGGVFAPSGNDVEGPVPVVVPVREPEDLDRIQAAPAWHPSLVEQITASRMVVQGLRGDRVTVQTLFSPLGVLGNLATGDRRTDTSVLKGWFREHPAALHHALGEIAETLIAFGLEILNTGVDGIFYAPLAWAARGSSTDEEYREFGRPYDLRILHALADAEVKFLHVCRTHNMLTSLLDYPVDVFHWDTHGEGNPSLGEVRSLTATALAGGISNATLLAGDGPSLREQAGNARREAGTGLLLAGSCSIPPTTTPAAIEAVLAAVRS